MSIKPHLQFESEPEELYQIIVGRMYHKYARGKVFIYLCAVVPNALNAACDQKSPALLFEYDTATVVRI